MASASCLRTATTDCSTCPLRELDVFVAFPDPVIDFIRAFKTGELTLERNAPLLTEGNASPHLYTVLSGWLYRYKMLDDGRRQIVGFVMPGDFVGLQSSIFDAMHHSVETLTETRLCVFARDRLWEVFKEYPELAFSLTWLAARSERLLDEHLLSVGAHTAAERLAFVLMRLYQRAEQVALVHNGSLAMPITQQHLAEALGLSLVHTNRTLKTLAARVLLTWSNGRVSLDDRERLAHLAGIEPGATDGPRPLI